MKLKNYETVLRQMIEARGQNAAGPDLSDPDVVKALEYWASKDCVTLTRAWGGQIVAVTVTPTGLTYFDNKRFSRLAAFWPRIDNFLSGFVAGVLSTLVTTWIIQRW